MLKQWVCLFCFFCFGLIHGGVCERVDFAIQYPALDPPPSPVLLSSSEIAALVGPVLKQRIKLMQYDRTMPMTQFLKHYEKLKEQGSLLSPLEAVKSFKFDPLPLGCGGGPCLTLAEDVRHFLPRDLNPYLVLAKLPSRYQQIAFPRYSHVALVIRYAHSHQPNDRGFVLIDPSFDIDEPIVIQESGEPFHYKTKKSGIWTFYLSEGKIVCEMEGEFERMVYFTERVKNPIESSAVPMILADRKLSLLARDENGERLAHLGIELNKERIVWDQGGKRFEPIAFSCINKEWSFPDWFSKDLAIDHIKTEEISKIAWNKKTINSLYFSYIDLLIEENGEDVVGDSVSSLSKIPRD